jgi:sugar lactone lactonase YvrE
MGRRVGRVVAVSALALGLVGSQSVQLASADDEHPVGYSVGFTGKGEGGNCNFYKIDLTTGDAKQVNQTGVECADGLTFDDDGTLYAFRSPGLAAPLVSQLITIDLKDGEQHFVRNVPNVLVGGGGMTFDADGDLWLYGFTAATAPCTPGRYCLWEIDPDGSETRFVGEAPLGTGVFGLTSSCDDDVLAITSRVTVGLGAPNAALDEVHTSSAALERIVDLPGIEFPTGLDFEDDGDLWAIATSGLGTGAGIGATLFRIDPSDGTSQAKDITVGGASFTGFMNGLAVDAIECPEPPTTTTTTPVPTAVAVAPTFTG